MKKTLILTGAIVSTFLITGCGEALGNFMMKTGMVPDMKIENNQTKVMQRLNSIARETIVKTKLKPISPDKVLVFRESSTPNFCADVGWIIVKDKNGFNIPVKKKVGLFTNTVITNSDIDAVKRKAAKLGIEAINNYDSMSGYEQLVQYVAPYEIVRYLITPNKITGNLVTYYKCSKKAENECKKYLHDNKLNSQLKKIKYEQCLIDCSWKEHKKFKNSKEVLYGVKAWVCAPLALKEIRNGQTVTSVKLEFKTAKVLKKIVDKFKSKKHTKKEKVEKANIFKF